MARTSRSDHPDRIHGVAFRDVYPLSFHPLDWCSFSRGVTAAAITTDQAARGRSGQANGGVPTTISPGSRTITWITPTNLPPCQTDDAGWRCTTARLTHAPSPAPRYGAQRRRMSFRHRAVGKARAGAGRLPSGPRSSRIRAAGSPPERAMRERPHERHDGYPHTDGTSEHPGPALGWSFRVVSG